MAGLFPELSCLKYLFFGSLLPKDPGGFKQSPLKLNAVLGMLTKWTEDEIKDRATKLASESLGIWVAPNLDGDLLKSYQSRAPLEKLQKRKSAIT